MSKIIGATVGTTTPRPNWNQTDASKADYIKNKPEKVAGDDGFSPTIKVTETADGHKVDITDVEGTKSFTVLNGKDGAQGEKGEGAEIPTFTFDAPTDINTFKLPQKIFPEFTGTAPSITKTRRIRVVFTNNVSSSIGISLPNVPLTSGASTVLVKEAELEVAWCGSDGGGPEKGSLLFTLIFMGYAYYYRIGYDENFDVPNPISASGSTLGFTKVS